MKRRQGAAALLGLTLWLFAAAGRAVVGGTGIDANTPQSPWAGVGAVETGNGHFSGALIGPRHALTAAHVVAGRPAGQVLFRLNRGDGTAAIPARAIHVLPAYRGPGGKGIWHDDLAIIELAQPAPAGTPVYGLYDGIPARGALIAFVGYGLGGDGLAGAHGQSSSSHKRVGYNRLEALRGKPGADRPDVFLFDFDAPADGAAQPGMGGPVGEGWEANFAGGDSGAPVFVFSAGAWRIAGVAAFVSGTPGQAGRYGSVGGGMLVATHMDWIRRILEAAPAATTPRPAP